MTPFNVSGSTGTDPTSINALGVVAGTTIIGGSDQGFIRTTDGTITTFTITGSTNTVVNAIDSSGNTYGEYRDSSNHLHGFIRDAAGNVTPVDPTGSISTNIFAANNHGVLTWSYDDGFGNKGFIRAADGTITTFQAPASKGTVPMAINDSGVVAGNYGFGSNPLHGFIRATDGTITTIDDPQATKGTFINAINNDGTVVGDYQTASGFFGFVRDAAGNFTTILPPSSSGFITLESLVSSINSSGEISGYFVEGNPTTKQVLYHGFIATPAAVPEPSSLAMLALGASGLFTLARRRSARVS